MPDTVNHRADVARVVIGYEEGVHFVSVVGTSILASWRRWISAPLNASLR
jgi:hypothetical protein